MIHKEYREEETHSVSFTHETRYVHRPRRGIKSRIKFYIEKRKKDKLCIMYIYLFGSIWVTLPLSVKAEPNSILLLRSGPGLGPVSGFMPKPNCT